MNIELLQHLTVNKCGKVFCKPDWQWNCGPTGKFDDLDMWVIVSGKGTLQTKDKNYQLSIGDCFILNDQVFFLGRTDPDFPLVVIYIHFDFFDESGNNIPGFEFPFYRKMANFPFFVQILERVLMLKFNNRNQEGATWLMTALLEIKYQDEQLDTTLKNSSVITFIKELCHSIRAHPELRFSLKDEAKKAYYSSEHFARLFKEYTGVSFSNYILQSRIEAATLYLISTSYNIGRIAEILGYNDIYLFSRQFKKVTGRSPTMYRNKIKA